MAEALSLIEGSVNANLVFTNVTKIQKEALINLEKGETVYQTDGSPSLQLYNGTQWIAIDAKNVVEYSDSSGFPAVGSTNTLYIDKTKNLVYRWSNSQYVNMSSGYGKVGYAGLIGNGGVSSLPIPTVDIKGVYYVASSSITSQNISLKSGDWAVCNGTSWDKINNNNAVVTVNSVSPDISGNVMLTANDISGIPGLYQNTFIGNQTAPIFVSTVTTGTAPFTINSTTVVPNLNVNLINGVTVSGTATLGHALIATSGTQATWQTLESKADLVNGKIPTAQLPDSIAGQLHYLGVRNMSTALPAAAGLAGGYYITSVAGNGYAVGDWAISNGASWDKIDNTDAVSSVNGKTGAVTLTKADIILDSVDNTADINKPISTLTQAALNQKANLSGATFTGDVNDSRGNLRAVPQNSRTSAYTLALSDIGKHISITTGGITVPSGIFSVGDVIVIYNNSSTAQPITCSSVTAYMSGVDVVKTSMSMSPRGLCSVLFYSATSAVISGDVY
jgi:hypothetical protein